jgi:hypothetical protein
MLAHARAGKSSGRYLVDTMERCVGRRVVCRKPVGQSVKVAKSRPRVGEFLRSIRDGVALRAPTNAGRPFPG